MIHLLNHQPYILISFIIGFIVILLSLILFIYLRYVTDEISWRSSWHNRKIEEQARTIIQHIKSIEKDLKSEIVKVQGGINTLSKQLTVISEQEKKLFSKIEEIESDMDDDMEAFEGITKVCKDQFNTLKPLEKTLSDLKELYNKLLSEEKKFSEQEKNINSLVERHVKITELSVATNKTTKDVFELMRVYLMNSIVEYTERLNKSQKK